LIPLGLAAALAGGSWWFFSEAARGSTIAPHPTLTTTLGTSQAATQEEESQTALAAMNASQTAATTSEESQATVAAMTTETLQSDLDHDLAFNFPIAFLEERPTEVDVKTFLLKIDGDVSTPLELTVGDLYEMPTIQRNLTIQCGPEWAVKVPWEGIALSYLLKLAGTAPEKLAYVDVESITNYGARITSDQLTNPDNMIALKAGGLPLTIEHGYPARLVVPGIMTGADWVKYVTRITCKTM